MRCPIAFQYSSKTKKNNKCKIRVMRENHQQKIRWFLESKKKKKTAVSFLFIFFHFLFCFYCLIQVFVVLRGTIGPSPIKQKLLNLNSVSDFEEILKKKNNLDKQKNHFFYLLISSLQQKY